MVSISHMYNNFACGQTWIVCVVQNAILPIGSAMSIVVVVTKSGRYEFTNGEIFCSDCQHTTPHDVDDEYEYGDFIPRYL